MREYKGMTTGVINTTAFGNDGKSVFDNPSIPLEKEMYDKWSNVSEQGEVTLPTYTMKSWTHLFSAIWDGKKFHDLRKKTDRDFKIGQIIKLQEFDHINGVYTGRSLVAEITYITSNMSPCAFSSAVLDNDYAILSIKVWERSP